MSIPSLQQRGHRVLWISGKDDSDRLAQLRPLDGSELYIQWLAGWEQLLAAKDESIAMPDRFSLAGLGSIRNILSFQSSSGGGEENVAPEFVPSRLGDGISNIRKIKSRRYQALEPFATHHCRFPLFSMILPKVPLLLLNRLGSLQFAVFMFNSCRVPCPNESDRSTRLKC